MMIPFQLRNMIMGTMLLINATVVNGQDLKEHYHNGQFYSAELRFQNGILLTADAKKAVSFINGSNKQDNVVLDYDSLKEGFKRISIYNQAKLAYSFEDSDILKGDFELTTSIELLKLAKGSSALANKRRPLAKPTFVVGLRDSDHSNQEDSSRFIGLAWRSGNPRTQSSNGFIYAMSGRTQLGSAALTEKVEGNSLKLGIRKVGKYIEFLKDDRPFATYELESEKVNFDQLTFGSRNVPESAINEISLYKMTKAPSMERNMSQAQNFSDLLPNETAESKYYALIIGNNNYEDPSLQDLDQPISDATKLWETLTSMYQFDSSEVTFLKDASRRDMIVALDRLSNELDEDDNLLIFYAGHGHWDREKETGYWLPVDAEQGVTVDWVRNSTIQGYIEDIKAKHILLITDACFAGGIFKTRAAFDDADRSINNLYRYESRKAITSGMLNEVPDRSVFMENLLQSLNDNQKKYLSTSSLFFGFRENVMNNSDNAPQFGTIHNTGDKGGEFIFILKD